MNNYNDFPILNNDQYKALNEAYKSATQPQDTKISSIFNLVSFCINSCLTVNTNYKLSTKLIECKNRLTDILHTFTLLYPNQNSNENKNSSNIFLLLSSLTKLTQLIMQLYRDEKRKYYQKTQYNISKNLLDIILEIQETLSSLNITFYKFM